MERSGDWSPLRRLGCVRRQGQGRPICKRFADTDRAHRHPQRHNLHAEHRQRWRQARPRRAAHPVAICAGIRRRRAGQRGTSGTSPARPSTRYCTRHQCPAGTTTTRRNTRHCSRPGSSPPASLTPSSNFARITRRRVAERMSLERLDNLRHSLQERRRELWQEERRQERSASAISNQQSPISNPAPVTVDAPLSPPTPRCQHGRRKSPSTPTMR